MNAALSGVARAEFPKTTETIAYKPNSYWKLLVAPLMLSKMIKRTKKRKRRLPTRRKRTIPPLLLPLLLLQQHLVLVLVLVRAREQERAPEPEQVLEPEQELHKPLVYLQQKRSLLYAGSFFCKTCALTGFSPKALCFIERSLHCQAA